MKSSGDSMSGGQKNRLYFTGGKVGLSKTNPAYPLDVLGDIHFSGSLLKNGTALVTGISAVTATTPLTSSGGSTPNISIPQAGSASNGYLTFTNWNTIWASTYNASYHSFNNTLNIQQLYNATSSRIANISINQYLANANESYLSTFNATYDAFVQGNYSFNQSFTDNLYYLNTNPVHQ